MRKTQRGRGSQRPVESELTPAQILRASLSPHREISPILFFQPDQRPSASVSDLVSFGGSDDELADDSMSLVASDDDELSGLVTDPAPLGLPAPSAAKAGMDAKLFRVFSKAVEELGLEWSPPEEPSRSRLDEWFLPGAVRPLNNDHHHSSLKFTTSSRDLGAPLTLPASVLPLHLPSLRLMALKKRDMRRSTEAQKASQAMRHFLPKRSSPAAAQSRPRTVPTQQPAKPAPAVFAPQPARTQQPRGRSRSARRHPTPKRQGPRLKTNRPSAIGRRRRAASTSTAWKC